MALVEIIVPDQNDSISSIAIEGKNYNIRFTYNPSCLFWSFGIYDENMIAYIPMTRIVPRSPLLYYYSYDEFPHVMFSCETDREDIGRDDFKNGIAHFYYMDFDTRVMWGGK